MNQLQHSCLQGEKRKKTDSSGGSRATWSQVLGAQKVDCYLCSLSCSQGREGTSPRLQAAEEEGCSSC